MGIEGIENLLEEGSVQEIQTPGTEVVEDSEPTTDTSSPPPIDGSPDDTPPVPTTSPDVVIIDNVPDPEADATQDDVNVEQTDNSPTEADGSQEDVDQNVVKENEVQIEDDDDSSAS